MKQPKKHWLAGLLAGTLFLGNLTTPSIFNNPVIKAAAADETTSSGIENWKLIESDRYTENAGDSFIDKIGTRNGNITVDNRIYSDGLEMWIARWNYRKEKSWAWATYALDSSASSFTGTLSILKNSPNTTSYDTTIEISLDDEVVYSYRMTPDFTPQDINISLEGASTIKISAYDNEANEGGTSFCIGTGTSCMKGDVDMDGDIDPDDAYLVLKAYASYSVSGKSELEGNAFLAADVDENENINPDDAYYILKYYATASVGGTPDWDTLIQD